MEVRLSQERERFVHRAVEGGKYPSASAAIEAALCLLETRDGSSGLRQPVLLGLEQALAGRSSAITVEDMMRKAIRRRTARS